EDGDVARAAAEIVDGDDLVLLVVQAVGQRGGGRLIDDAQDVEAGDLSSVARGRVVRVVEVGGDGDDGFGDVLAQEVLGERSDLHQHEGRDLLGRVLAVANLDLDVAVGGGDDLVRQHLLGPRHLVRFVFPADEP